MIGDGRVYSLQLVAEVAEANVLDEAFRFALALLQARVQELQCGKNVPSV